jgi:hypothetical protein
MRRTISTAGLAGALFLLASPWSYAGPVVTLDDLLKGMSLKVGDMVFSNFDNFSSVGFLGGKPVDPKLITVVPTTFNGNPGLMFQSASQFMVGMGQQQQTYFTFDVTASASLISAAALSFTAAAYGGGSASIAETVAAIPNGLLVSTLIPNNYAYGQLAAPLASLTVGKNISLVGATDPGALTFLSDFTYSFDEKSGGSGAVPEPATLGLFAIGVIALIGYRFLRNP